MKVFTINKQFSVVCNSEKTRYGFRHLASLHDGYMTVQKAKCCYYNRTWESYEFQSVVHQAINAYFDKKLAARYIKLVDKKARGIESKRFDPVKAMCKLGEILANTPEEKVDWKKRMIGTVPGIDFPDDFDSLSTEEKERRLNKAVEVL